VKWQTENRVEDQIFNPYLTIFAEGLGVDVILMGRLVSILSAMGILAPVLGAVADRLGYRLVMRLANWFYRSLGLHPLGLVGAGTGFGRSRGNLAADHLAAGSGS